MFAPSRREIKPEQLNQIAWMATKGTSEIQMILTEEISGTERRAKNGHDTWLLGLHYLSYGRTRIVLTINSDQRTEWCSYSS